MEHPEEKIKKAIKDFEKDIRKEKRLKITLFILCSIPFVTLLCGVILLGGAAEKVNQKEISALDQKCASAAKEKGYKFYSLIQGEKNTSKRIEVSNCAMSNTEAGREFEIIQIATPLSEEQTKLKFKPVPN